MPVKKTKKPKAEAKGKKKKIAPKKPAKKTVAKKKTKPRKKRVKKVLEKTPPTEKLEKLEEKKAIKKMVDEIPSMILQDIKKRPVLTPSKQPPAQKPANIELPPTKPTVKFQKPQKQMAKPVVHGKNLFVWMWAGVIIFSLAIFIIWFFNIKTFLYDTKQETGLEERLLSESKDDLQETMKIITKSDETLEKRIDEIKNKDEDQSLIAAIRESFANLILEKMSTSTDSVTSTIEITTSTIEIDSE